MYDPLKDKVPIASATGSYWQHTCPAWPSSPMSCSQDVDVAIIGAGYTGLSAALHLARHSDAKVMVLDAVSPGWGCAGRNAGFALAGSGRLSLAQMQKRWGSKVANGVQREYDRALTSLYDLIDEYQIDCDLTRGGYLRIAHSPTQAQALRSLAQHNKMFIDADTLKSQYIRAPFAHGGLFQPASQGLNPLKLCHGLAHAAQSAGVNICTETPVIDWHSARDRHTLTTPHGKVKASKVIIASNAYSGKNLHAEIQHRQFPVLSSIIVTAPLNNEQKQAIAVREGLLVMDTRPMKYYYRMLPDGRLLFGGRGAVTGALAEDQRYKDSLTHALHQTLPGLGHIDVNYFWSGWVSIALDDHPRLWKNEQSQTYVSMGYCGSGVSYACYAGQQLGRWIMDDNALPALPIYAQPLPRFPLPWARRPALSLFYNWLALKQKLTG
ncbi:NAD(P)/FAD-dependent oxidoreductase [Aestuariibacter salexigens]|uniref:NAD(P)/FAD-dependent oxidoreductase n=1 Tax=Aestuariibacter salexigens TaxID=226010 RepID=UPI0004798942|nr:FAD-binding oxidoreductase [Aestuariibacter salexigens]